jgi:hypothetical protein
LRRRCGTGRASDPGLPRRGRALAKLDETRDFLPCRICPLADPGATRDIVMSIKPPDDTSENLPSENLPPGPGDGNATADRDPDLASTAQHHDALFKDVFGDPAHAAEALRAILPPQVAAHFDWNSFEPDHASVVSEGFVRRAKRQAPRAHGDTVLVQGSHEPSLPRLVGPIIRGERVLVAHFAGLTEGKAFQIWIVRQPGPSVLECLVLCTTGTPVPAISGLAFWQRFGFRRITMWLVAGIVHDNPSCRALPAASTAASSPARKCVDP